MTFYLTHAARPALAARRAACVLLLFALALALAACGGTAESPSAASAGESDSNGTLADAAPGALRIATFNTEFLFDGEGSDGRVNFARSGDAQAAQAHLRRVAGLIARLRADAVMLQEVENESVLHQLVESGPLGDMGYTVHFVQGADSFTGQDVGLLARVPVAEVGRTDERAPVGGDPDEDYGVSKNLFARLDWQGTPVTLIGVHFLARPDDASRRDRREAQAEVIRRLVVREQEAGHAPVVLGDFNDFDTETLDVSGSRPITAVLQTIKRAGRGPADNLQSVMPRAPRAQRYTAFYDRNGDDVIDRPGELSAIDHLLAGPALMPRLSSVRYVHSHDPVQGPDHFPLVATFAPGETTAPPASNTRE